METQMKPVSDMTETEMRAEIAAKCADIENRVTSDNPFMEGLSDPMLRVMLQRYAGPALETARAEAHRRGWPDSAR